MKKWDENGMKKSVQLITTTLRQQHAVEQQYH